jgi:hypothetical protein
MYERLPGAIGRKDARSERGESHLLGRGKQVICLADNLVPFSSKFNAKIWDTGCESYRDLGFCPHFVQHMRGFTLRTACFP